MSKFRALAAPEEWYHCYNRGVEKRITFHDNTDYRRFQLLLFCSNTSESFMLSNVHRSQLDTLYTRTPSEIDHSLVEIGAYSLMPNHFHVVLKELTEGGRAKFMQKLITAYSMYFNTRHRHNGPIFSGTYKAKHIDAESYLRQVCAYVILNPADLGYPGWKERGSVINLHKIERFVAQYPWGSGRDQLAKKVREEHAIIGASISNIFGKQKDWRRIVHDAQRYYREMGMY